MPNFGLPVSSPRNSAANQSPGWVHFASSRQNEVQNACSGEVEQGLQRIGEPELDHVQRPHWQMTQASGAAGESSQIQMSAKVYIECTLDEEGPASLS